MTVMPECPACRVRMEEGFVGDAAHHGTLQQMTWRQGPAERSALSGLRTKGRRFHEVISYRCPRCGWLLWFAPDKGDEK